MWKFLIVLTAFLVGAFARPWLERRARGLWERVKGVKGAKGLGLALLGGALLLPAVPASANVLVFVGVAHTMGFEGAVWRSDLMVIPTSCHNPPWEGGSGCVVDYTVRGIGRYGEYSTATGTAEANVGSPIVIEDVYGWLNMTDSSGVLRIESTDNLTGWVYTYALRPDGSRYGQAVRALVPLTPQAVFYAVPSPNPNTRIALWAYNASDGVTGSVEWQDGTFITLAPGQVSYQPIPDPGSSIQVCAGCQPPWGGGGDPSATVFVIVTEVDNLTNDSTVIPLQMIYGPPAP